jgi:hypothetical protein
MLWLSRWQEEKYMNGITLKPRRYDELVMDGTRGVDQVAVFITSLGKPTRYMIVRLPIPNSDTLF